MSLIAALGSGASLADSTLGGACPVTETEIARPPDDPNADPFPSGPWYINADRSIWAGWSAPSMSVGRNKVLWIKPRGVDPVITARRVDGGTGEFEASVPCCYPRRFHATALEFSAPGCWEVTGVAGASRLVFTTIVAPEPDSIPFDGPPSRHETITFPSTDGVEVTADLYRGVGPAAPTLVLFHQSMSSRGEFRQVAPRLADLGYNALAVDLRWGRTREGVPNETAWRFGTAEIVAKVETKTASPWPTIYASYGDMKAALHWLDGAAMTGPRFVLGSSFSAMLVYRLGAEEKVAGVIAYSPGEYDEERPNLARGWAAAIEAPVLSVAAPGEEDLVAPVANSVTSPGSHYAIAPAGRHGASMLDADHRNQALLTSFLAHHGGGPPIRVEEQIDGADGKRLVVDRYDGWGAEGLLVLFHQGGGSARGEYGFLIPRLLGLGFDVVAADLYGGGDRFGFPNRTMQLSPEPEDFSYCDALPDVLAVLEWARRWRPDASLTAWGSSYSAALVLHAAAREGSGIKRLLAFSPASGGPMVECSANDVAAAVSIPALIVRPEREARIPAVQEQLAAFRGAGHRVFVATPGAHGSSTLNPIRVGEDVGASWEVVSAFLRPRGEDSQ